MKSRMIATMFAALTALGGCGSAGTTGTVVVVGDGVLVVDWTLENAKDPNDCAATGADSIDVVVSTSAGDVVGDFNAVCEAFELSVQLAPGSYYGNATLLDAAGRARTTAVDLGRFSIYGDDELHVPIDFPFDSFY